MAKYQKALTAEEAIERAIAFLEGLKPEHLGSAPKNIRIEELEEDRYWIVALSFETDLSSPERITKEISMSKQSGKIVSFLNYTPSNRKYETAKPEIPPE